MPSPPSHSPPQSRASPGASSERDSPTPSQLDIIAERNERTAGQGLFGRSAVPIAIASALTLLGAALWWFTQRADAVAPGAAPIAEAASTVPAVAADAPAALQVGTEALAPNASPLPLPLPAATAASMPPVPEAIASAAARTRKARAGREAELRAAALPAPSQSQPREADKAREVAADARPGGADPATSAVQTAAEPRPARDVRELCAPRGNIVSEMLCRTRECRKPERDKDATCVRLREIEEAQRRVDTQ